MQRTEHYSLPQWGATDALKRLDFNEAMWEIDAALAEQKGKQETGNTQLWSALLPMSEPYLKQRFAAMDETALTAKSNLLLNPLSSAEMAESLSAAEWDSTRKVNIGRRDAVARTYLRSYSTAHKTNTISASFYMETNATYDFTAPRNATVTNFDLQYYIFFSEQDNKLTDVSMTFRAAKKTDSGYTVFYEKSGVTLELSGTSAVKGAVTVAVNVPLEQGEEYRFSLTLDSGYGSLGQYGFTTSAEEDDSRFTVKLSPITAGSHTREISLSGQHSYCLGVFRWRQEEGDGGVTPTLNGVGMEEWSRSETADGDATVYEVTGLFTGDFTDHAALAVHMTSSATDLVQLTGYGLFLM